MTFTADLIWTDHPAWLRTDHGTIRVIDGTTGPRLITVTGTHATVEALDSPPEHDDIGSSLPVDRFTLPDLDHRVPELSTALRELGTVARIRTGNLWEAIAAAILRDHIGAYRSIAVSLGQPIRLPSGVTWPQFPAPEALEAQTPERLARFGIGDAAPVLRMAANLYTRCGPTWEASSPDVAVTAVQTLPGVDETTARLAVVDWSGRFDLYPLDDPQLRAWAIAVSPRAAWPTSAQEFSPIWTALAGNGLKDLTGLIAAWAWRHQPFRPPWLTPDMEDEISRNRNL